MTLAKDGSYGYELLQGKVPASGDLDIAFRKPDKGERIRYMSVAVENTTSTDGSAKVGVSDANYFYTRAFMPALAVGIPQTYDSEIVVVKDDTYLTVRIISATANDVIEVAVSFMVERDRETE